MNTFLGRAATVVAVVVGVSFIPHIIGTAVVSGEPLPCGNIIGPASIFNLSGPAVTTPVVDCADPFVRTIGIESPYSLFVDGAQIQDGAVVEVAPGGTNNYHITGQPLQTMFAPVLYRHDGGDYRFVDISGNQISEVELRQRASEFFAPGTDVEPYILAALSKNPVFEDDAMLFQYYDFMDYVDGQHVPVQPHLLPGTYTLVLHDYQLILGSRSFIQTALEYVIPTAHAADDATYRFTITFTLVEKPTEPVGASSVLFLPGIQSSRLYTDGIFGTEDQIWPPSANFGQDLRDLSMTPDGASVRSVYTRDVIGSVFGVGSIYGGFLDFLAGLKTVPFPIKDYTAFAYDWRFSAEDVAVQGARYENETRSLIDEVERLASGSYTGKVTIIAHSNGGLVAKALITELDRRGLAGKVDRVVFIATPQLGTPKAIASILHGHDQGDSLGGVVMSARIAREVINNMPGAYGLLPSRKYFERVPGAIIDFGTSTALASFRSQYGQSISTFDGYRNFLIGANDANRSFDGSLGMPAKANQTILDQAFADHIDLDSWVAPQGIEVIEIVGVGLPTIKSITYRTVPESVCTQPQVGVPSCVTTNLVKPLAVMTKYGDATVVKESAESYEANKTTYYVDLKAYNNSALADVKAQHFNLTEVQQVRDLIKSVLGSTTFNNEFISSTNTTIQDEYSLLTIDSPVSIKVADSNGNVTGTIQQGGERKIVRDISGSQYFELGETKYLIIPSNVSFSATMVGEAYGGYTLTTSKLRSDDSQVIEHQIPNASTTPSMTAMFTYANGQFSSVKTDVNGDGAVDTEITIDGAAVQYTYADIRTAVKALTLPRVQEKVVLDLLAIAEQANRQKGKLPVLQLLERVSLRQIDTLLEVYKNKKLITLEQYRTVSRMLLNIANK